MTSWINRTVGVAAKNGTNSHTISFTAASSGSLLVVIVAGAVTHTMSTSGYTSRLAPVNNTELHVWTKTASAGESSFTVTHNASDYAVNYAVYEFASGSTWAGGTSSANTSSWPTLSSLTGTNSVFGAISELNLTGDGTVSGTPTSPWVEDVDNTILINVTEGDWFYVLLQDGYSSATATPADTDSGARTDERAVWAINVASGAAAPAFPPNRPARRRAMPPRRYRGPQAPVRAQVNPPAAPTPARAIRQQRGLLVRRAEVAQVVPQQQAAAQAPALTQRVTRERVQAFLQRARQLGDTAPPQDQQTPPLVRAMLRRRLLPRREQNATTPPGSAAPAPPGRLAARRRWPPARRSEVAVPVPTQTTVQPPPYPPSIAKVRRWWAIPRRAEVATPVPAQVVLTPPAYPPAPARGRRFGVLLRRGRTPSAIPAQVVTTPPAWPTTLTKARRQGVPPRRGHAAGPVPAQVAPVAPAYPPTPPRPRRLAVALRRRQPTPTVQTPAAAPPLVPHARPRIPARVRRPPAAKPVPVQIAPPWVPVVVRGLRRVVATVRRTRPGVWLFGGTGAVGATQGFAGPGDGLPAAAAGPGDGLPGNTAGPGDGTTYRASGG